MYNYIYIQYIQYITNRAFAKIGAPKISTVQALSRLQALAEKGGSGNPPMAPEASKPCRSTESKQRWRWLSCAGWAFRGNMKETQAMTVLSSSFSLKSMHIIYIYIAVYIYIYVSG